MPWFTTFVTPLRAACVRAVNDWSRELYEESGGRFIMLLPLPCQTPQEAVVELLRVAEFGLPTGVIFDWVGAPEPVMHQIWERVWAAAAETGMPVNLHANPRGGSRQIGVGVTGLEPRNQSLMTVANFPMGLMAELLSAVVFSGICDRYPGVRFVLEEAGVGWVPFLFWRFDREYNFGGLGEPRLQARSRFRRCQPSSFGVRSSSPSRSRKRAVSGAYQRLAWATFVGQRLPRT